MPTEGASWERRELLREKRYDRGEKISFVRGRREGATASVPQPPLALNPVASSRSTWPSASARQGRSRHFSDDSIYGTFSSSSSDILCKSRSRLFLDDGSYGQIPSPSSEVLGRGGRSRLFLDDGAYGPFPSPSADEPAREKIFEDENLGFQIPLEGRYNRRNRELVGSGPRAGYVASELHQYEDSNLGFRMDGRYTKRGREPVGSGVGYINPSSDILDLGKSYEDENGGFRVEGRFNRRSRELLGSTFSTRRPSFDDTAKEKFYEDESPPGFSVEGMYSKRGRELGIVSDLSSNHSQRDRKYQNWDGELIVEPDLSSSYPHRDRKTQHWCSGQSSFLSTGRQDTVNGKSVDHMSLHSSHLYFDKESSWDRIQSQELYMKTALEHASSDNKLVAQMVGSETDYGRFSRDFESKLDTYGSFSSSDSFLGDAQNSQQDHLDNFISRKPLKWEHPGKYCWSSLSGQIGSSKEPDKELKEPHDIHGSLSAHDSTLKLSASALGVMADDETHSRKKQRLGWGQGLAKYEKRKVEGPEDESNRGDIVQYDIPPSSKMEEVSLPLKINLDSRSPKVNGSSGCMSPATTYSITCISSPADEHASSLGVGIDDIVDEEKECHKIAVNDCYVEHAASGVHLVQCALPVSGSESILVETSLEHLEQATSLASERQNEEVITSSISDLESSPATSNLLSLKNDMLQKLENTEHEIEKYESGLRLLLSEIEFDAHGDDILAACTEVGDKDLGDSRSNALDVDVQVSLMVPTSDDESKRNSLDVNANQVHASCVPSELESMKCHVPVQKENAADMMVVGFEGYGEDLMDNQSIECQLVQTIGSLDDMPLGRSQIQAISEIKDCKNVTEKKNGSPCEGQSTIVEDPISVSYAENDAEALAHLKSTDDGEDIVSSIIAANKKLASEAMKFTEIILPADMGLSGDILSDVLDSSMWKQLHERNTKQIEAKMVEQRQSLVFKERALALKFRVLRQLWKDDQYSLPTKRQRARAQKRSEISGRSNGGNQRCQLPVRSRFASPGTSRCPPSKKAIELAGKLISDCQDRPCRSFSKMPALVLDDKEKLLRFTTLNGIVDDPIAVEKERTVINPWTSEEREIFMERFAMFGKNFSKIASFLEHKTVADCIEFYYKNQKSEIFEKVKKMHKLQKDTDCHHVSTYLATAGNNRHRDSNAVSLDVLNASSVVPSCTGYQADVFQNTLPKNSLRTVAGFFSEKQSRDARDLESERECTAAADVLAGICGALSSEAVSSCITGGADQSELLHENSFSRSFLKDTDYPLITEAPQSTEIHYSSEEGCDEEYVDWTDDEKAFFVNAVSMFGRDFESISRYVGSRTEEQCKTFFSKVRKRLGLDELMLQESHVPTKNSDGSDDDERGGLIDVCTALCDIDSSTKMPEVSEPKDFIMDQSNTDQSNFKAYSVTEGAEKIGSQDNEVEFFMEDATAQNEDTGQKFEISSKGEHFLCEGSLADTGIGSLTGTLIEIQHNENTLKVKDDLCCNNKTETHIKAEPNDGIERFHGVLGIENTLIVDDKRGSKGLENVGSTDSSEKVVSSPCNIKESCCSHVTSGLISVHTTKLSAPVLNQSSLQNLKITYEDAKDECTTSLHGSGNVSNNENYLIGSVLLSTGSDPSDNCKVVSSPKISVGMGSNDVLILKPISNDSVAPSLAANETSQVVVLDQKASCPITVSRYVSESQYKFPDVFCQVSQTMVHHMPQLGASSSLVRNQKLESIHYHPYQRESQNQAQEKLCPGAILHSMQQSDTSVSGSLSQQFEGLRLKNHSNRNADDSKHEIVECPADTEESPRKFGDHRLMGAHQRESQSYSSQVSNAYQQGSLQQSACNIDLLSQVSGGYQLLATNLEDGYLKKSIDASQHTTHKLLVQGGSSSQVQSQQQHQAIQQNLHGNVLQASESKEYLSLATQFIQKPISKQQMWEQRNQLTHYAERSQQLHLWQQGYRGQKGQNIDYDNHMPLQKESKQVDHKGNVQFKHSNKKFKPNIKPVYNHQSSFPCLKTDEQTENRGDVKLFGQILQSHSSNLSKLPPRSDVNGSTVWFEGRKKLLDAQENDEHTFGTANVLSEQKLPAKYFCMYSEGIAGKTINHTSWKLKESNEDMTCFAEGGSDSKANFKKAGTVHSRQEFGGQNFQFWEDSSRHDRCMSTSQTGISYFSKELDSQCTPKSECLSGSASVDQAVKAGKFQVLSLDSSMIPQWHGSMAHDVPYLTKEPSTARESDYYPLGYKELGNSYIFSLGVKQPDLLVELRKGAAFDRTLSDEPGKCDTVQSILPFHRQMRNISSHMGIQAGRVLPGGSFVSDPVVAFRMQCSTVEQVRPSIQHPHFRSTGDQGLGR